MRTVLRADLALTMDPGLGVVTDPEVVLEDGLIAEVRSLSAATPAGSARDRGPGPESPPHPHSGSGRGAASGSVPGSGPADPAPAPDADTDDPWVLDLPGRWLLPGLVNAHTHAAMTLLRGYADDLPLEVWLEDRIWPVERYMDVEAVHAGTLLGAGEMLAGGVTTLADMYLYMDGAAAAVRTAGIRAVLGVGLFKAMGPTEETLEQAVEVVRRWDGAAGGRIRVDLAPHAVYTCPPEFLAEIVAAARDLGARLHIHLSESRGEVERVRESFGASPVAVAAEAGVLEVPCLAAHCVWVDEEDRKLLAEAGTGVAHCPRSNMKLASGVAPVPELLEAGIPVGLGTDGAASANQLTVFEEMRIASLLQKVTRGDPTALPAQQVVEMATLGGARALGLDGEVGSLTPGKRADLAVLRLDRAGILPVHDPWSTVAYAAQDQDVEWVFCDGRPVARGGQPLAFSVKEARAEARRVTVRLLDRAGIT